MEVSAERVAIGNNRIHYALPHNSPIALSIHFLWDIAGCFNPYNKRWELSL